VGTRIVLSAFIIIIIIIIIVVVGPQPWVGLGLLKLILPVPSILGIRPPISTTKFSSVLLHSVNPS
jgi:hypothetical protein